jgi:hypothetical protein
MRADNTAAIIRAAQQRHQLTRAKAIRALRELDHSGEPVTFEAVARAAGVSRSWLLDSPTFGSTSSASAKPPVAHPPRASPRWNEHPLHRYSNDCRQPPRGTDNSPRRTSGSAGNSRKPLANSGHQHATTQASTRTGTRQVALR